MFDVEGKWPNKVEQTGSTLGLSEIRTFNKISQKAAQKGLNINDSKTQLLSVSSKRLLWHYREHH